MDAYDMILALVEKEPAGCIVGRTTLHKKLFFLNELIHGPIHFFPHYYGPYSREVASTVDSLVSAGLLIEHAESIPGYVTPWGESTRYTYSLPSTFKQNIESVLKQRLGSGTYTNVCSKLDQINKQTESGDYKALSIAAKVVQILKGKQRMRVEDFPKEARRLGWRLSDKDVNNAASFLQKLKLLKKR